MKIFERIADGITRHPLPVAGILIAVFCFCLYGMTTITMQTGWETYVDKNSPDGIVYNKYIETFQSSDPIIVFIETDNPINPTLLLYIDNLEAGIRGQQNIKDVLGMTDLLKTYNYGRLPTSEAEIKEVQAKMPPEILSAYQKSNLITVIQINTNEGLSDTAGTDTLNNIQAVLDNADAPPGVTLTLTGSAAFKQQMETEMGTSTMTLIGIAMLLMVIVMGTLFSYVSHRFLPVLIVGIGLVIAMGAMGLTGIKLNMAVIGAFPVLIGLGIDYAIQFHARFDEEMRKGTIASAVYMTVTKTGPAVLFAMLATCMGFVAMFISPVPMIQSFGLVAIIGVASCYFASLIGIPVFAVLLKYKPKEPKKGGRKSGSKLNKFSYSTLLTGISVRIAKNPIPVLLIAGMVAVVGFQVDSMIPVQTSESAFVPSDMPAKVQNDKVTRLFGSTGTAPIYIHGDGVNTLTVLNWITAFEERELERHSEITRSTSIVTYVIAYNGGVMPVTQDDLNSILDRIPAETKKVYISGSTDAVVVFNIADLEMSQRAVLKDQIISDIEFDRLPAGLSATPSGNFDLFTKLIGALTESREQMTALGFVLVFLFLVGVYRKIHAVTPLVPIIIVVGWNAIAMYLLGIDYTPLTATLGSMTIGVAAEYTILVMERYAEEFDNLGNPMDAIRHSVERIGTSITVSGLATFFGFSALVFASFPIISNFGITTLIAVGFSLTGAIVIMPAILSVMGRFEKPEHHAEGEACLLPGDDGKPVL
jgi:hydrophobe/amphiphile efflux-3 (HAE3) family protein